eukprot:5517473-Pyramimonas_sp.AAC.1
MYGSDVGSCFKKIASATQAVTAWSAANLRRRAPALLKQTPAEALCIAYIENRFDVGASFDLVADVMGRVAGGLEDVAAVDCEASVDAALVPKYRATNVSSNDVIFTVVGAKPESKKVRRDLAQARVITQVAVRVCRVLMGPPVRVSTAGAIQRLDIRGWCSSPARWSEFVTGLLRCDLLDARSRWGCANSRAVVIPNTLTPRFGFCPMFVVAPEERRIAAIGFSGNQGDAYDRDILMNIAAGGLENGRPILVPLRLHKRAKFKAWARLRRRRHLSLQVEMLH